MYYSDIAAFIPPAAWSNALDAANGFAARVAMLHLHTS
jgi:hypothetical protein